MVGATRLERAMLIKAERFELSEYTNSPTRRYLGPLGEIRTHKLQSV